MFGFALLFAMHAVAQVQPTVRALPAPEKIRAMLLDKTPQEQLFLQHRENDQENLKQTLQLHSETFETTCGTFDSVSLKHVTLEAGRSHTVLVIRSEQCWYDFVVILRRAPKGHSTLVATYPLFSKYDHPSVSFPELIGAGIHEILIGRKSVGASGTGVWQYDTLVIKLFDGRPRVIFNQPTEANLSVPSGKFDNTEEFQHSKWYLVPAGDPNYSRTDILEEQVACVHRTKLDRWWLHSWNPRIHSFEGYLIDEPSAKDLLVKGARYHTTTDPEDEVRSSCK
jgi:hypothetical protein